MIQIFKQALRFFTLASAFLIFAASCNQTPPKAPEYTTVIKPGIPFAQIEISFDLGKTSISPQAITREAKSSTYLPGAPITLTKRVSNVVLDDEITNRRYITTIYEFTNQTTNTFQNLTFYALNQASNTSNPTIGGTAFRAIQNSDLQPITNPLIAQSIRLEHGVIQNGSTVITDINNAHLQAFTPSEAQTIKLAGIATNELNAADDILEYGFVATNLTGGRTIPAGGTGRIALGTSFPIPTVITQAPSKFNFIATLVNESVSRVTRGFEETTAAAIARAGAPINATEVALIGSDTDTAGAGLTTVRLPSIKTTSATSTDQLQAAWAVVAAQPTVQALNIAIDTTTLTGVTKYGITSLAALETNGDASIAATVAGTTITRLERSIHVDEEMSVWDLLTMGRIELGTASEFTTLFDTDPNNDNPQQLELLAVRISALKVPKLEPLAAGLSTPSEQATTRISTRGTFDYFLPVLGCPLCENEERAFYIAMRNDAAARAAVFAAGKALDAARVIANPTLKAAAILAATEASRRAIINAYETDKAFTAATKALKLCYKKHPECAPKMSNIAPVSLQLRGRVGYIAYKNLEVSNTGLTLLGVNLNLIVPSAGYSRPWLVAIPARKKVFIPIGWLCLQPGILNAEVQITANNDPTFTTTRTIPITIECLPEITLSLSADATALASGATTGVHATMTNDVDQLGVYWNADVGSVGASTPVSLNNGVFFAPIANPTNRTATIVARAKGSPLVKKTLGITIYAIILVAYSDSSNSYDTSISGAINVLTATVGNDASSAGVTWSIPSGIGTIYTTSGVWYYKAPLVNPAYRVVNVLATSKADPSKTATTQVGIYAISVAAYADGNTIYDTSTSGGINVLTSAVNNDASSAGVTWSVPSGIGTVYTANGYWYYKAPFNSSVNQVVDVVATAKADTSKTAITKVSIYAISVAAYADGNIIYDTSISGGINVLTSAVSNDASSAGVTWSVPSAIGTVYSLNGTWYYKAPLVNPANRTVDVVATSISDPSKTATTRVTIYAIGVAAYSDGNIIYDTSVSGGANMLTSSVSNDASSAGVTWSIYSGSGSISGTTFTAPVLSCYPRGSSASFITVILQATSIADSSKFARTTITVNASQCP